MRGCFPKEVWLAVILTVIFAETFAAVYCATRITPEREAELKAQGAAEADRRAAADGGWDKWLAKEVRHLGKAGTVR